MNRVFVALFSLCLLIICDGPVFAQEPEEIAEEEAYKFPEMKPEAFVFGGPRFAGGDGRADQYEYLHDSLSLGGELRIFSFPHRLQLEFDLKDRKDYFGDVGYAYKDIILFRGINRTVFHNLENINLIDLNPATPSPGVDVRDSDEEYGLKTGISDLFLRFKFPDFPLHVYLGGSLIEKNGTQQQMSLLGSGYFNDTLTSSQRRSIDWEAKEVVIGSNSHLGPIEVDISHGEKRFDVKGDKVLFDTYSNAFTDPLNPIRVGGIFPHNLIPEFKSSSNTLKIHTSYTGSLVASATFSNINKENRDNGAKADYFIGEGEVTWMPFPRLTFLLKYRHREADIDNPGTVTLTDISNPSNTYAYSVKPSLSSSADTILGTVRYRPISGLTLRADYSYENIDRENSDDWDLPRSTTKNIVSLSADMRLIKGLTLKAKYTYKNIENPAYNFEPDHSNEGKVSLSWIPVTGVNTLVSYSAAGEHRHDMRFVDFNDNPIEGPGNRNVKRDKLLGSVTFLIAKDVSLTTSYSYMHNKTQEDLVFLSDAFLSVTDPLVPYRDIAHNYTVDLSYMPKNNLTFNAGVSHTISSGTFFPGSVDLLEPVSIASFSDIKIRESIYSVSGEYRFKNGFALGVRYKYSTLDDVLNNPYDDVRDGNDHVILVTISKRW